LGSFYFVFLYYVTICFIVEYVTDIDFSCNLLYNFTII